MGKVKDRSIMILVGFYLLIGVVGFLSLNTHTPALFIEREKPSNLTSDEFMLLAKILFIMALIVVIPMNVIPCRNFIY